MNPTKKKASRLSKDCLSFYIKENIHPTYLAKEHDVNVKTILNWWKYHNIILPTNYCKCGCGKKCSSISFYISGHNPTSDWNNDPIKKKIASDKASATKIANYKPAHNRKYSPGYKILEKMWIQEEQSVLYISKYFNVAHFVVKRWLETENLLKNRQVSQSDTMKRGLKLGRYASSFNDPDIQNKCQLNHKIYNRSKSEKELFAFVDEIYPGEVLNSYGVNNINIDIYIPNLNIGIEYNGLFWHSEARYYIMNQKSVSFMKNYHKYKSDQAREAGIHLIHIWEDDWHNNNKLIKNWLKGILNLSNPKKIYGRKCQVKELSTNQAKFILNSNHLQGYVNSSIRLGLYHQDKLISAMTFINSKDYYNLSRYVIANGYQIIGGFSKLLKYFVRNYDKKDIVSFADLSWVNEDNNVYLRNGFIVNGKVSIDYKYIWENMRIHKFNFRHKNLKNKLHSYDPDLTENQNCVENSVYRIWDSGKIKYIYKNS